MRKYHIENIAFDMILIAYSGKGRFQMLNQSIQQGLTILKTNTDEIFKILKCLLCRFRQFLLKFLTAAVFKINT